MFPGHDPDRHLGFCLHVRTTRFPGQDAQPSYDIAFAVMVHRVQDTLPFDDDKAGPSFNDVRPVFDSSLDDKPLPGFNAAAGHFIEKWASIQPFDKLQKLGARSGAPFLFPHHLVKVAGGAGKPLFRKGTLNASAAERSFHRPADSPGISSGIDPVIGGIRCSRTYTGRISILASDFPAATHYFPAVELFESLLPVFGRSAHRSPSSPTACGRSPWPGAMPVVAFV